MHLPEREIRILEDLIGRKIEGFFIAQGTVSLPVEAFIQLADGEIIKIDSCSRLQHPTETLKSYPQLRVQKNCNLPRYPLINLVDSNGEIIQSVQVMGEQFQSDHNFVTYTNGICIHLMGKKALSIMRKTFRHPALEIILRDVMQDDQYHNNRNYTFTLEDL